MEFVRDAVTANPELVTMEDDSGWTLLLISSASSGHPEIVRFLLTNPRTNVNQRNDTGQTSLHYACSKNHMAIVQALIDAGADVNAQDERNATPLHRAASKGHQRIVNLLMGYRDKGLQIDLADCEGNTPLHLACEDGESTTAIFLVNNGADLGRANRGGQTPLDLTKDQHFKHLLIVREASRSYGS